MFWAFFVLNFLIKLFEGSRCETFFTTTTPYCSICQQQAAALAAAIVEAQQAQLNATNSQKLAYQASSLVQLSASYIAALSVNQTQSMIRLNSEMQSGLLLAINQSNTETNAIVTKAVLKAQASASNATFLLNQTSSFAQSASSLASSQVSQQLLLLSNMVALTNSTNKQVYNFQSSKAIANMTQHAILFSQSQVSTQLTALNSINNALLVLNDTETQVQILQVIVSQTIAYTSESYGNIAQLIQIVTTMESIVKNMSKVLNSTLLVANAAKEAAIQVDKLQAIALQASIKASRLALCYPSPCLNGGMCVASPDNSSFTCFCSSLYKGPTCQDLKVTSVFNLGNGFSNYESMIRADESKKQGIMYIFV